MEAKRISVTEALRQWFSFGSVRLGSALTILYISSAIVSKRNRRAPEGWRSSQNNGPVPIRPVEKGATIDAYEPRDKAQGMQRTPTFYSNSLSLSQFEINAEINVEINAEINAKNLSSE